MPLIKGIHHIALKCANSEEYDKCVEFYHNVLKMPIKRSWQGGMMLDTGSGYMEILTGAETQPGEGVIRHFALFTDYVDTCIENVTKAGYKVYIEPTDMVMHCETDFPIRIAFCYGPLGELVEFFCER